GAVHDVVEAALEHDQQVLAGGTLVAQGLLVGLAELLLEHAVDVLGLLLLLELRQVLAAGVAAPVAAVRAGRERAPVERAPALLVLEDLGGQAPGEAHLGSGVTSHCLCLLLPSSLSRGAAWAGCNRCGEPG